jgi:hypothetical protein
MLEEGNFKVQPDDEYHAVGGLRLLVQKWPHNKLREGVEGCEGVRRKHQDLQQRYQTHSVTDWACYPVTEGTREKRHRLPFSSPETLNLIMETFHLPQSYPYDFTRPYSVPIRFQWIEYGMNTTEHGANLGSSIFLCM